jgi:carbonic anhydrase
MMAHHTHQDREPPEAGHVHEWVEEVLGIGLGDAHIFRNAGGGDLADVDLDPALPELNIGDASIAEWVRMTDDIDEACSAQAEYLKNHPLIPDVPVTGYVYEVESGHLRRPGEDLGDEISERA